MEKKKPTRENIIQVLKELDAEGKQPGRKALKQKGINGYWVEKLIPEGLTELKLKHGIKISPQERPRSEDELLKKIDEAVSHLKRIPSWAQLRRETGITDKTFTNRFGNEGIREVFSHYRKWLEEHHPESENIKLVDVYLEGQGKTKTPGEPELESSSLPREVEPIVQDEIQSLLTLVERALCDRQQDVERLTEENQKLRAGLEARTKEAPEVSFVHTSPDFHHSWYDGKVTSIKDTIVNMLKRAEHAIRISTRQMDMFTDDLIALKRRSPDIEISVLSRGPQGAEGDRKKLAGRAFEKMKEAGIKLSVEKDTLHSRLVVIDTKEVLVSSADLDYTQMELEFNAGIWTNNPDVVAEAIRYFDNLLKLSQGN